MTKLYSARCHTFVAVQQMAAYFLMSRTLILPITQGLVDQTVPEADVKLD